MAKANPNLCSKIQVNDINAGEYYISKMIERIEKIMKKGCELFYLVREN